MLKNKWINNTLGKVILEAIFRNYSGFKSDHLTYIYQDSLTCDYPKMV